MKLLCLLICATSILRWANGEGIESIGKVDPPAPERPQIGVISDPASENTLTISYATDKCDLTFAKKSHVLAKSSLPSWVEARSVIFAANGVYFTIWVTESGASWCLALAQFPDNNSEVKLFKSRYEKVLNIQRLVKFEGNTLTVLGSGKRGDPNDGPGWEKLLVPLDKLEETSIEEVAKLAEEYKSKLR